MTFRIQASHPRTLQSNSLDDVKVEEAMETVFPMWAEDAYMIWDAVHIPIGYKYTLSCMITDALQMLEDLLGRDEGESRVSWFVQEFNALWYMKWRGDELHIRAEWHDAPNSTEQLLASKTEITVSRAEFIAEWKKPLSVILSALRLAGYDESRLSDMKRLQQVHDAIPRVGILYRDVNDA